MAATTAIGMVVTAGLLGVTHGIEPDHVAGISALTEGARDSRLSAVVGASFATGHVVLVVGWLVVAVGLLGATTFPPLAETVGLTIVGAVLVVLAGVIGGSAGWRLVHRHEHEHGDGPHAHFHLHLPGRVRSGDHDHEHSVLEYVKIGVLGAMFTLSPPLSMIVFVSVVLSNAPVILVVPVVLAYAVAIVFTMSVVGYGAGTVFRMSRELGVRVHAAMQIVVAGVVLVVAVHLLSENVPALLAL